MRHSVTLTQKISINSIPSSIHLVLKSIALSAKNVRNVSLFIINNLQSSYIFNKDKQLFTVKDDLFDNQKKMIEYFNQAIDIINQKTGKSLQHLSSEISSIHYNQIMDYSVVENIIKLKEKNGEFQDYSQLPSVISQSTLQKACDDFRIYRKAFFDYLKNPDKYSGKPEKPNYKEKQSYIDFVINYNNCGGIKKSGQFPTIQEKHKLYLDFGRTKPINKNLIDEFSQFNFRNLVEQDMLKNSFSVRFGNDYKVKQLRFIPDHRLDICEIEYIVEIFKDISGPYEKLNILSSKYDKDYFSLKLEQQKEVLRQYLAEKQNFMSLDPGKSNFVTIAYSNGKKGQVITAGHFHKKINKLDSKTDNYKANFSSSVLSLDAYKDLCKKQSELRESKQTLSSADLSKLKEYCRELYSSDVWNKMQTRKNNIIKDYIHKLSHEIIKQAKEQGISLIIVGRTKGLKENGGMLSETNREFHNIPHTKFYELLKYKALMNDILVVETEESYTSKTSFIDGETLQSFEKQENGNNNQLVLSGKRNGHIFRTKDGIVLHADLNGSYNIARKIFPTLQYNEHTNIQHVLIDMKLNSKNKFQKIVEVCKPQCKILFT